ncbi:adenine nucleotide alpha hydrolase family protein, partial [Parvimonas micra]
MENKEIKDIMENRENNLQATCPVLFPENERAELKDIERSLIKRYRKNIWSKFVKAIKEYNLIEDGDKIAVAISGGKDSLIMAKLFQELKKNGKDNFELEFIAMDPGYHPSIKELLLENANYLEIPLTYYPADIFAVADKIAGDYP